MSYTPLTSANNLDAATLNAVLTEIDQTRRRLPPGGLVGLQVNVSSTITVSPGLARDDTDTVDMVRTTAAGNLSITPLSGTGANKLDTGTVSASTWYYVFLIAKTDGTVAGLVSLSATSPTLPSGYVYKRRIGAVRINGSSLLNRQLMQDDGLTRRVYWLANMATTVEYLIADAVDVSNTTYDTLNFSGCIPPTAQMAQVSLTMTSTTANIRLYYRVNSAQKHLILKTGDANKTVSLVADLLLTNSQTIEIATNSSGTESLTVYCNGYSDSLACAIV